MKHLRAFTLATLCALCLAGCGEEETPPTPGTPQADIDLDAAKAQIKETAEAAKEQLRESAEAAKKQIKKAVDETAAKLEAAKAEAEKKGEALRDSLKDLGKKPQD